METTRCVILTGTIGHNRGHHRQRLAPHQLSGRVLWARLWEILYTLRCVLRNARKHNMLAVSSTSAAIIHGNDIPVGKVQGPLFIWWVSFVIFSWCLAARVDSHWQSFEWATLIRFQSFAAFWIYYVFFWVVPRRLNYICRRFGTLYLFHLHRHLLMKKEQIECSETSAYKTQTPGNYPKENNIK